MFTKDRKKVISNVFRDVTKAMIIALLVGSFVPGKGVEFLRLIVGFVTALLTLGIAVYFGDAGTNEGGD